MSSHQPVDTAKNRPLGTQAAPVCEGGVSAHGRLMTADCSPGPARPVRPVRNEAGTTHRARFMLFVGSSPQDL